MIHPDDGKGDADRGVERRARCQAPDGGGRPAEWGSAFRAFGQKEAATVSLKGLNAYYGERHIIRGIDIDFPANEVTAIIGPSGCGKSTLVRCINRMHEEIPGSARRGQRQARRSRRLRLPGSTSPPCGG